MAAVLNFTETYIFRSSPKDNFTTINNELINDTRLKDGLLGMLIYMLSKPFNWRINTKELAKRFSLGIDTINKRLNELSRIGYLKRIKPRSIKGIYTQTKVYVSDNSKYFHGFKPELKVVKTVDKFVDNPVDKYSPPLEKPALEKAIYNKKDLNKTLSKQDLSYSSISSCIKRAREELGNQITVSKPTLDRNDSSSSGQIFKRKIWGNQLTKMRELFVPKKSESRIEDRRNVLLAQFEQLSKKQRELNKHE